MARQIGYGASVYINDGNGGAYQEIENIISITPPNPKVGKADITHLNSPAYWMESIPGLLDPGEVTVTCRYTDEEYERHFGNLRSTLTLRVRYNDDTQIEGECYCSGVTTKVDNAGEAKGLDITFQMTGTLEVEQAFSV